MKLDHVKPITYIDFTKENNKEKPKFEVGDHVILSKYEKIFPKDYVPGWSKELFVIKKVENTVPWTYFVSDLNGEKIVRTLNEKELQKANQ